MQEPTHRFSWEDVDPTSSEDNENKAEAQMKAHSGKELNRVEHVFLSSNFAGSKVAGIMVELLKALKLQFQQTKHTYKN